MLGFFLASAPVLAADPPDPRPEPTRRTMVHITSNSPLSLRRDVGRFGQIVCEAPCDRIVAYDPTDSFSVTGNFVPAPPFRLETATARTTLRVDAGSRGVLYTGITFSALGGATVSVGGMLYLLAALGSALGSGNGIDPNLERGLVGTMIGGGVAVAVGIPLVVVSGTKVEILPEPRQSQARGILNFRF